MQKNISKILENETFSKTDIINLLKADENERQLIFKKAHEIKEKHVGLKTYYRGLVEFSNICYKNCFYCGIRAANKNIVRYDIDDKEILEAVEFAYKNKYASVVFQSGERDDDEFIERIENLLKKSKQITNNEIGITISLGEQTYETYKKWFDAGAHRYLLRIETSNKDLFYKIHPKNEKHNFEKRLKALKDIKKAGYQTGTGVMIGLPFQTIENLADDLLFFKENDIDMIGMGPFIEHTETPLYQYRKNLLPLNERFILSLKMIAILRIMMKDINIAAATALQAIDALGREKALKVGANIIMPNITPTQNRTNYQLYENKPCIDEGADDCTSCLEARIVIGGDELGYNEWGDSPHFSNRKKA
ncbi:MAG: [FeFe] hydrogenase H-cluster radical SAM maturase HydE [Bacteroidales bacterium]|nr:[FeFe] hydrogenase H-cluster radical SAM maturase HydE [Bacteroidales bacterium]MBN2757218.1 [FeFe] hydrogenase H-cluster radical SAM maturase HydE [Bacteroidales bacterium]